MNVHKNAKLTVKGREVMVHRVLDWALLSDGSAAFGLSTRTVRKWVERYRAQGFTGLQDRSSRHHC